MKTLIYPAIASLFIVVACKKEETSDLKVQLLIENNRTKAELPKKYDYMLIQGPGQNEPIAKECKVPNGNACRKKARGILTQYEWDTFFSGMSREELLNTNVNNNTEWLRYQEKIGFGH